MSGDRTRQRGDFGPAWYRGETLGDMSTLGLARREIEVEWDEWWREAAAKEQHEEFEAAGLTWGNGRCDV